MARQKRTTVGSDTCALFASAEIFSVMVDAGSSSTASATFLSDLDRESRRVRMASSSIANPLDFRLGFFVPLQAVAPDQRARRGRAPRAGCIGQWRDLIQLPENENRQEPKTSSNQHEDLF